MTCIILTGTWEGATEDTVGVAYTCGSKRDKPINNDIIYLPMKEPHQITTASTMNILVIVKIKVKIIVTIIRVHVQALT